MTIHCDGCPYILDDKIPFLSPVSPSARVERLRFARKVPSYPLRNLLITFYYRKLQKFTSVAFLEDVHLSKLLNCVRCIRKWAYLVQHYSITIHVTSFQIACESNCKQNLQNWISSRESENAFKLTQPPH